MQQVALQLALSMEAKYAKVLQLAKPYTAVLGFWPPWRLIGNEGIRALHKDYAGYLVPAFPANNQPVV